MELHLHASIRLHYMYESSFSSYMVITKCDGGGGGFSLQHAVHFIMLSFFGSCNINILNTGCAKILNKIPPQHIHLLNILNMLLHTLSREIRLAKRPWPVGVFTFHYFKLYFHLRLCLLRGLFPSGSPTKLMNF